MRNIRQCLNMAHVSLNPVHCRHPVAFLVKARLTSFFTELISKKTVTHRLPLP
jgi:hypothetical protein